jgi:DNA-binding beta-propeller fold protein YncE
MAVTPSRSIWKRTGLAFSSTCPTTVNVIDRRADYVGLNGAKADYPMTLDEDDHRLFVVTRRPPLLAVLDTDTRKEVARVPVGGWCDDVYFDSARKRIYALGSEGFISVVQQNDPNHYTLSANIPTTVGLRTGVFFGTSLYAGVPAAGLEPAQIWNYADPNRASSSSKPHQIFRLQD